MEALVMGGGLSGLATAVNLLNLGIGVTVVEASAAFGGRAGSFRDEDGDLIENGLHLSFPWQVNLLDFLDRTGSGNSLARLEGGFHQALPGGRQAVLEFGGLPAPLHAARAMAGFLEGSCGIPRWKVVWALMPIAASMVMSQARVDQLDNTTLEAWAGRYAPLSGLKLAEPLVNAASFARSSEVSAGVVLNQAIRLLGSSSGADASLVTGEPWVNRCAAHLQDRGG